MNLISSNAERAERRARAAKRPLRGLAKPARAPSGGRSMYSSNGGLQ